MTTKSVPFCIWTAVCLLSIIFVSGTTAEAQAAVRGGSNQAAAGSPGHLVRNTVFEACERYSRHDHCGDQSRWAGPPNWLL